MTETTERDLKERLALIESMMLEGRKTTEFWGWMFVLWGVGYIVAIVWSMYLPHPKLGWPVTMIATAATGLLIGARRNRGRPNTTKSRALGAVWAAVGIGIFIFAFSDASSAHVQVQSFMAAIETMIGIANAASSLTLRWRAQFAMALVWWASAAASCWVSENGVLAILIAANLIGNIGFGLYLMRKESRAKAEARRAQVLHA